MIIRYNNTQTIKAILFLIGGIFCCLIAYLFFYYVPVFLAWQLKLKLPTSGAVGIALFGLAATWFSGYRTWKAKGGLYSYHESGLYHDLGDETHGAYVVDFYAHRITGPAYILGQIFIAGPQFILRAITLFRSRITYTKDLESKLEITLATLQAAKKWQSLDDYPDLRSEILYLAQMSLIDFSGYNGSPRIKAC